MPEQALGWLPLGLGLVMEDEPSELSCSHRLGIILGGVFAHAACAPQLRSCMCLFNHSPFNRTPSRRNNVNRPRETVRNYVGSWRTTRRFTRRSDGGVSVPCLRTNPSGRPSTQRRGRMCLRTSFLLWRRRRRWVWSS